MCRIFFLIHLFSPLSVTATVNVCEDSLERAGLLKRNGTGRDWGYSLVILGDGTGWTGDIHPFKMQRGTEFSRVVTNVRRNWYDTFKNVANT